MQAAVYENYGPPDVLEHKLFDTPVPRPNEVLIRTRATTVTSADHRARALDLPPGFRTLGRLMFGLRRPRQPILGQELAGDVEAVGKNVRSFKVGDPVVAYGGAAMGCHATHRCIAQTAAIVLKPANLSYEEAAALSFGGLTAVHFLRAAKLRAGETVLVNGASGAVGTACVQLAKHYGAEVTGVCSTNHLELVRSLGAAHVVDYTREDFTRNGKRYDVIVDTIGTAPYDRCSDSLTERGRLARILGTAFDFVHSPWVALTTKQRLVVGVALGPPADLRFLANLAEAGAYKPVVGRTFRFSDIAEAHRYVDTGHKTGNAAVTFQ